MTGRCSTGGKGSPLHAWSSCFGIKLGQSLAWLVPNDVGCLGEDFAELRDDYVEMAFQIPSTCILFQLWYASEHENPSGPNKTKGRHNSSTSGLKIVGKRSSWSLHPFLTLDFFLFK